MVTSIHPSYCFPCVCVFLPRISARTDDLEVKIPQTFGLLEEGEGKWIGVIILPRLYCVAAALITTLMLPKLKSKKPDYRFVMTALQWAGQRKPEAEGGEEGAMAAQAAANKPPPKPRAPMTRMQWAWILLSIPVFYGWFEIENLWADLGGSDMD
jgi:hypothetical protein